MPVAVYCGRLNAMAVVLTRTLYFKNVKLCFYLGKLSIFLRVFQAQAYFIQILYI